MLGAPGIIRSLRLGPPASSWSSTAGGRARTATRSSSARARSHWRHRRFDMKSVQILGAMRPGYETIPPRQALACIVDLEWKCDAERRRLLALRNERQARLDAGAKPDFLPETKAIR